MTAKEIYQLIGPAGMNFLLMATYIALNGGSNLILDSLDDVEEDPNSYEEDTIWKKLYNARVTHETFPYDEFEALAPMLEDLDMHKYIYSL